MNILDENIDLIRRQQLLRWRIHVRQIGLEIGHAGMKDRNEIIPLLHSLRQPTLLTRDDDFYGPQLRHARAKNGQGGAHSRKRDHLLASWLGSIK